MSVWISLRGKPIFSRLRRGRLCYPNEHGHLHSHAFELFWDLETLEGSNLDSILVCGRRLTWLNRPVHVLSVSVFEKYYRVP